MGKIATINCDLCDRDISYTGSSMDYRIVVKSEAMPHKPGGGAVTEWMGWPEFPEALYFCNRNCFDKYFASPQNPDSSNNGDQNE
jgi:hypothetical protein